MVGTQEKGDSVKPWLLIQTLAIKIFAICLILEGTFTITGWLLFFGAGGFVVLHLLHPRLQGLCDVTSRFITDAPEVWLTIDDGPSPEDTPQILDLLDEYNAKATFFVIGERAESHPELIRQVLARGHEIGAHTYTHPVASFWFAGASRTQSEVEKCHKLLQGLGANLRWFRAPVGIKNFWLRRTLREHGLHCVSWSIRSGDSFSRSPESVTSRILSKLRPGAILLLHEGSSLTESIRVHAIAQVLQALQERGYRCVLPGERAVNQLSTNGPRIRAGSNQA